MTKKVESLIEKCKSVIPLEGRILVHPLKLKTYKEMQTVNTDVKLDLKSTDIDIDPIVETEQQETIVNKRFQEAIVIGLPDSEVRFEIGDTIIYGIGSIFEFDFIKGVSMIHKYDPIAIVNVG